MRNFNVFCDHLEEYIEEYGDGFVPHDYISRDGYKLGYYVRQIRYGIQKISQEERDILDLIQFEWVGKDKLFFNSTFVKYFAKIKKYYEKYGDCDISESYIDEEGKRVGSMVALIRAKKDKLNALQIKMLDEIGFIWKKRNKRTNFEKFCKLLKKYKRENGHCCVPVRYVTEDEIRLGEICRNIRHNNIKINDEQKKILDSLGFVWNSAAYKRAHKSISVD